MIHMKFCGSDSFPWFGVLYDPTGKSKIYKYLWRCKKRISAMSILFFCNSGPLLRYDRARRVLHIDDLNPQISTQWAMTRWEMVRTGWRFIKQGILP